MTLRAFQFMIQHSTVANSSCTVFSNTEEAMTVNNLLSLWQSHCLLTPWNRPDNENLHSFSNLCKSHLAATFFHPLIPPWECTEQIWQQVCSSTAQTSTSLQTAKIIFPQKHSQTSKLFMSTCKQHKILDLFFSLHFETIKLFYALSNKKYSDSKFDFHHMLLTLSF